VVICAATWVSASPGRRPWRRRRRRSCRRWSGSPKRPASTWWNFSKHQRKDDVTQQYLKGFEADEGVLYIGRAQEKARVLRTERRRCARTGMSYPSVVDGSAMVNHYYFYCVDSDFGPFWPREVAGGRVPALRFGDANAQGLLNALLMLVFVALGFTNKDLRQAFAVLLGRRVDDITPGRISYELRRLRLHVLIRRLPKTHRYQLTDDGLRTAQFYTRLYSRLLPPAMAPIAPPGDPASKKTLASAQAAIDTWCDDVHIGKTEKT
jgi:hypothetical protein